jgi:hypothetical protein
VTDAGSTYGDKSPRERMCISGVHSGIRPQIGECVIIETEGESSKLQVEQASGC